MSQLAKTLEELNRFKARDAEIKNKALVLQAEAGQLEKEFRAYMVHGLGLPEDKQLHLSEILTKVLESNVEPKPQIIL